MAVSLLIQHCSKSLAEDCGGSSHIPVDRGGGVKIEVFTSLIFWSYVWKHLLLLMQDIKTSVLTTIYSQRAQIISPSSWKKIKKYDVGMACLKVRKQGRDDAWKQRVNILAKPHSYIFFTLQLDSILESCLFEFYTMTSLQFTQAQGLGYIRGMCRVPCTVKTDLYDTVIKVYMAWF